MEFYKFTPLPLFATPMGVAALGIVFKKAAAVFDTPTIISDMLVIIGGALFVLITFLYLLKVRFAPDAVKEDIRNPVRRNFLPAFNICLLLFAIAAIPEATTVAKVLTGVGAVVQISMTLYFMGRWWTEVFSDKHCNPTCLIPIVGNVLVGVPCGKLGWTEIGFGFWSIAFLFWIILLTNNFSKLVFGDPLPEKLVPSLFILIAPPAVFAIAYVAIVKQYDLVPRFCVWLAMFFALLMIRMGNTFLNLFRKNGFMLSYAAFSFPPCALAIAMMEYHHAIDTWATKVFSIISVAAASAIIAILTIVFVVALFKKMIFVPEVEGPAKKPAPAAVGEKKEEKQEVAIDVDQEKEEEGSV